MARVFVIGASLPRLEIRQIRRRLIFLGRHQLVLTADDIMLVTDEDVAVVFGAIVLEPDRIVVALVAFGDSPGMGQGMIIDRDFVMQRVGIGFVDVEALRDDGFAVLVEWDAGRFIGAWSLESARLDLENVITAIAILIDPLAN